MGSGKECTNMSSELHSFIFGISRRNFQNSPELTKTGVTLLRNFPATREAVLEYFSLVFRDAVNYCINPPDYEDTAQTYPSMEAVSLIGSELSNLSETWAVIVAPWCIELLKDIATELSKVSTANLQSSEPVRILLEITTTNLTKLKETERAQCIDILLTHRQCDWVVGCVGRFDPWLVVPRVVALGVRDDARHNIDHVVATLSHLSTVHTGHIRDALMDLFNESLNDKSKMERKNDIIPYLLHLASKSDAVLKALSNDIQSVLDEQTMDKLSRVAYLLRNSPSWETVTPSLLVSLCARALPPVFKLLLSYAPKNQLARQLLEHLLQNMESDVRKSDKKVPLLEYMSEDTMFLRDKVLHGSLLEKYAASRVLILICHLVPIELVNVISYLLRYSNTDQSLALLVRILSGVSGLRTAGDSSDITMDCERLQGKVTEGVENALSESIQSDFNLKRCFILDETDQEDIHTYLQRLCLNLSKILKWEMTNKVIHLRTKPFSKSCDAIMLKFAIAFDERVSLLRRKVACTMSCVCCMPTCDAMADLLERIDKSSNGTTPLGVDVTLKMLQASTKYFFRCLHEKDTVKQLIGVTRATRLIRGNRLHSLSNNGIGRGVSRAFALRALLNTALMRETRLFNSRPMLPMETARDFEDKDELLMHSNKKQGPITQLTQSHTSVFHAGIIGRGARKANSTYQDDDIPSRVSKEIELLMGAVMACMDYNGAIVEGMTSVSLLLVELISPDVMYNGLPWPDEDFTKVSIERELHMRAALERCGTARAALRNASVHRPSLCLASALLRALAATALHQHNADSHRHIDTAERRKLDSITIELLETMCLGQLLPHPLNYAQLMLPHLKSSEIVQILRDCIWNYTRDHVPSPALFTCDATGLHWRDPATSRPPPAYTDTLRIIIQKNIATLGHLYPMMFLALNSIGRIPN